MKTVRVKSITETPLSHTVGGGAGAAMFDFFQRTVILAAEKKVKNDVSVNVGAHEESPFAHRGKKKKNDTTCSLSAGCHRVEGD